MAHQRILHTRTLLGHLSETTAIISLAALTLAGITSPASSAPQDPIPPKPRPWGYNFGAHQPGSPGGASEGGQSGNGGGGASNTSGGDTSPPPPDICGAFKFGVRACALPQIPTGPGGPAPPIVMPAQLAATKWQQLPIPAPDVRTAPPRGSDGLVGLAEWFWVANWSARTGRAQAGGVWAEVTARPTTLTISPGSSQPSVRCAGHGTAYDGKRSADGQRSGCSYTYARSSAGLPSGAYQVTATVTWGGIWVGSGGTGGTLPTLSRSTTFDLRVAEGQAVAGG